MEIEELFHLVWMNNDDAVKYIKSVKNINSLNEEGQTLLHEAAAKNNVVISKALLEAGIDSSIQDNDGQTALHYCALNRSLDVAHEIFKFNPNINIADKHGNQPLWSAVIRCPDDDVGLVVELMENGADPNWENSYGKSPLDLAIDMEDDELISILNMNSKN